jgi:hypothetical protein
MDQHIFIYHYKDHFHYTAHAQSDKSVGVKKNYSLLLSSIKIETTFTSHGIKITSTRHSQ